MWRFLKKHIPDVPVFGEIPGMTESNPDDKSRYRLNGNSLKLLALCVLVFVLLQWMGYHSPHWGKTVWNQVSEGFLLFSVTLALMPMYWLCAGPLRKQCKAFVLTWGCILVQLTLFGLIRHATNDIVSDVGNELLYLPYILSPLIVTALLGPLPGLFATIALCMLGGFFILPEQYLPEKHIQFWILSSLSGMLTVLLANNLRNRAQLLRTGFFTGLLVMGLCCVMGLINLQVWQSDLNTVLVCLAGAFGVSMMCAVLVSGILPLIEGVFKIITPISWLEMADMNRPLMKRLQLEAPGTFHHCLMVAQLAESAAEAIGANPVECRVEAYYHDIGKIQNPQYFVENITDGPNPHDDLTPAMSAKMILGHVTDGVALADEHKLPKPLHDVIEQHHGTSLVYFFYMKALKQREEILAKVESNSADSPDDVPQVDEASFRYPGPIPQSKEIGIVSLADIVESATRSMGKVSLEQMEQKVDDLLRQKVVEGHLDDSELTFGDLVKIKASFIATLRSMHHNRIAYPSKPTEKPATKQLELWDKPEGKETQEQQEAQEPAKTDMPDQSAEQPAESDGKTASEHHETGTDSRD